MSTSEFAKKASNHIPYCKDQGIDYIPAADKPGYGIRAFQVAMPAGGIVTFASLGLPNMADANYFVVGSNHTGTTQPVVSDAHRSVSQITITGPTTNDVLDFVLVGHFLNALST